MFWTVIHHIIHIGMGYIFPYLFEFNLKGIGRSLIISIIIHSYFSWSSYNDTKKIIENRIYPSDEDKEIVLRDLPYKIGQLYIIKLIWYSFLTLLSGSILG